MRHVLETAAPDPPRHPAEPTHSFWDTLVRDFRSPFVKRDLLLHNPAEIPSATDAARACSPHRSYDLDAYPRRPRACGAGPGCRPSAGRALTARYRVVQAWDYERVEGFELRGEGAYPVRVIRLRDTARGGDARGHEGHAVEGAP